MKYVYIIILFCLNTGYGQGNIDSMVQLYPQQNHLEKAKTLSELCYLLSFSDLESSLKYGKMGYEAAIIAGDSNIISRTLSDWSIPYLTLGNFDTVIVLNKRVLGIETREGDSLQVAATLNKLALASLKLGKSDLSLRYNLRALPIFEELDFKAYVGTTITNIGNIYNQNKMYPLAMEYYQKGLKIAEENNDIQGYVTALNNQGQVLLEMKEYKAADVKLKAANKLLLNLNNPEKLGNSYQTLGLNALFDNRPKEGRAYYNKALAIFNDLGYIEGKCLIYMNIAECFLQENKIDSADLYIAKSIEFAKSTNSIFLLKNVYKSYIRLENLKGNTAKADQLFKLYEDLNDSLYNAETNTKIAEMQVKYETEEKENALIAEKLKSKNTQLWLLIALISIVSLIIIVLFIQHRKKLSEEKLKVEALKKIEAERSRIARDLHDNLGADLTLISSKIDIQSFQQKDPNFKNDLEVIASISKSANAQLRDTIWSIHKSAINFGELKVKIADFASRTFEEKDTNIAITCSNPETALQPAKALHLFRITQEFLNNSFKYAQAHHITIHIDENKIVLKDDGIGFNMSTVKKGYGLNNIAERAKELNTKIAWEQLNPGTSLTIFI